MSLISLVFTTQPTQAAGIVASCDEAALVTALSGGGTVTFNFGAPCTITFTSRKTLVANTIIQNTGSPVTFDGGGTVGFFYTFTDVSLNVSDVTMQNTGGNGAILVQGTGLLTVNNVIFQNNSATNYGAAIRTNGGSTINMNISNSQFISNYAGSVGGAVYINMGGNYSFTNNTFTNNTAGSAPPNGQAIFKNSNAANITLTNNTFTNNTCDTNFSGFIDGGGNTKDAASVGCPGALPVQTITVEFTAASATFDEATPTSASFRITTSDGLPTATSSSFSFSVTGGTANSSDYTGSHGVVPIPAGTPSGVYPLSTFTVIDDNRYEADETVILGLNSPSGLSFGAQTTFTFNITDDEEARVHANPTNANVSEAIGTHNARFMLTIIGTVGVAPLSTDLPIDFTVIPVELLGPDDALEPEDFTTSSVAVYTFPAGTASGSTVNVPVTIVNDNFVELDESFYVKLASVSNGAILSPDLDISYMNRQAVQILDDDVAGYVRDFSLLGDISEPAGMTSFTIHLSIQPIGAGTVVLDFLSTAIAECMPDIPQITFDSSNWNIPQTITITASDDFIVDGTQPCAITTTRNVGLSTATEYASVSNPSSVHVNVLDNDGPTLITIVSGNPQSTTVNTAFGAPLVVEVRNASNQLVQGATVTFTAPGSGASASITPPSASDVNGRVSVTATAGTVAGTYQVEVTSGSAPTVNFNLTNTVGAIGMITYPQQPSNTQAGANITPAVQVFVGDPFGNPIVGQNVVLNLHSGTGTLSGTLTQPTNSSGIATFADLSINTTGTKLLNATAGIPNAFSTNFDITASSTVGSVAFVQEPPNAVAGANIAPAVTVQVLDGFSNPIAGQNVTISLTTGTGTLSGTLTQTTNASGIATFADLNINLVGTKQLTATVGAMPDVSANFDITTGAGANLSLVSGNPQQTTTNTAFTNPLVVRVTDTFGNPVAGETVNFVATVGGAGQTATLSIPAVTDVNGETSVMATANGIIGAYTVEATYGATTVIFDLTNLDPNTLAVNLACVNGDLVVTIVSGSANFNITSTSGGGMPLLNVPLGAYTFMGPDTWQNLTVTELGGDGEIFTSVGNVVCVADETVVYLVYSKS